MPANARHELLPEAAARYERTLETVSSMPLLAGGLNIWLLQAPRDIGVAPQSRRPRIRLILAHYPAFATSFR